MKDFQRDLDHDHVPHDSNREARAHVSDAIQIATPTHVQTMYGCLFSFPLFIQDSRARFERAALKRELWPIPVRMEVQIFQAPWVIN